MTVTAHASQRWIERAEEPDVTLERAWDDGIPVAAPGKRFDEARLHPPADVVLLRRGPALVTVLQATRTRIVRGDLVRCRSCENVTTYARSHDACEWCEEPLLDDCRALHLAPSGTVDGVGSP